MKTKVNAEKTLKIKVYSKLIHNLKSNNSKLDLFLYSYFLNCGYEDIYMSNLTLTEILGTSQPAISRSIKRLANLGVIDVYYPSKRERVINVVKDLPDHLRITEEDEFYFCDMNLRLDLGLNYTTILMQAFFESSYRYNKNDYVHVRLTEDLAETLNIGYVAASKSILLLEQLELITVTFPKGHCGGRFVKVNTEIIDACLENFMTCQANVNFREKEQSPFFQLIYGVKDKYKLLRKFIETRLKHSNNKWYYMVEYVKDTVKNQGIFSYNGIVLE